jgi:AraC-like DNA-binding protein
MLYYFALASVFTSSILAIYNWKVQKNTLYIAGILIILSAHGLTHYYSDPTESDFTFALLFGTLTPFWLLPGPLLYFYFRSILNPAKSQFTRNDLFHFVPFLIQLVNIIPYLITPFEYKLQLAHAIHENLNNLQIININAFYSFKASFLSRPILMLVYLLWCSLLILRQKGFIKKSTRNWLLFVVISLLLTTLAYLMVAINLFNNSLQGDSIATNPMYYSSGIVYIFLPIALILFFPDVLYGMVNNAPQKEINAEVRPEELVTYRDLANQINHYLQSEKPYLNPDFELGDIAKALSTAPKEISFVCKNLIGKKFTVLRTQLRIEYAKALLQKGVTESITIDAIGTSSGFKSRSTFYEAFKAETGMTPNQYLENLA